MRILILTNLFPSPWQPHRATFNRQQFAALAQEHDVRVIAPVAWTDQWGSRNRAEDNHTIIRDGMTVEHPTYIYPPKVLRSWHGHFFLRSVRTAFNRAVEQFRPDVVLASWAYPDAWAAVQLARRANLPIVTKVHGSDVLLLDQHPRRRGPTAQALWQADAVVTVSQTLAVGVHQLGVDPSRIHLVYNGVDTALFHPGQMDDAKAELCALKNVAWAPRPREIWNTNVGEAPTPRVFQGPQLNLPDDPMVLFIGNLVPVKGLDTLIEACSILQARRVNFRCCLIGQGALRQTLSNQIARAGLEQVVHLLGPRPLEQLPQWYRAASVLVLPSRSEGIPNVILEALACGTPVIASRVGGIPEILSEGSMVPAGDSASLAHAIERVILNPRTSSSNNFSPPSWNESAKMLATVLRNAIESRRKVAA